MRVGDRLRLEVAAFWRSENQGLAPKILDGALVPAEAAFRLGVRTRARLYESGSFAIHRPPVPVISVGNLTVGGTGKTPVAAWVGRHLFEAGAAPALVLRGYGRDEADLHRELNPSIPVYTAPKRIEAIRSAVAEGTRSIVLDDGFQHRAVARDVDIALLAADSWSGQERMLPRGPWREPLSAIVRATHVIITRKVAPQARVDDCVNAVAAAGFEGTVGVARLVSHELVPLAGGEAGATSLTRLAGRRVVAVSTLADPRAFQEQLRQAQAQVDPVVFPDHHEFTAEEVGRIGELARRRGATVVVTGKEAVKLRGRWQEGTEVLVLRQRVEFERGGHELESALDRATGAGR